MLAVGLDSGSFATKGMLAREGGQVLARAIRISSPSFEQAADEVLRAVLEDGGVQLESVGAVVATGYGRGNAAMATHRRTEIACHAMGVHHLVPGPHTVVDIGGQDLKVISVGPSGEVVDFSMNRKCAAGTGAFVEEIARRLGIGLDSMDGEASKAEEELALGSYCTVFASTELLKLLREGRSVRSIAKAAFRSVVKRIVEMGGLGRRIVLSGGVAAHNPIVAGLLAEETGADVEICPDAGYAGALGAAVYGLRHAKGDARGAIPAPSGPS